MPRTVAISMHDHAHAETHYLCEEANRIQNVLRFRDVYLDRDALTTDEDVDGPAALRHFHGLKAAHGLGPDDILVAVVQGNVQDPENDEYFSISHRGYDDLKDVARGVAILSLFFRMDPRAEFVQPRTDVVRLRKAQWWDPQSEAEQRMLLSNAVLLIALGIIATLATDLPEHEDIRGCIMDYCQDPFDLVEAFARGVEFRFCDRECRPFLEESDEGRALLEIATALTARPFGQPWPSIFISYARDNHAQSEQLLRDLRTYFGERRVWKDIYEILGGVEWEPEIRAAMHQHPFVVLCFSTEALAKPRFFHKEVEIALGLHQAQAIHVIPVRFDEVDLPPKFASYHYIDLFPAWREGIDAVIKTVTRLWKPFAPPAAGS